MAVTNTTVWRIRISGSNSNGGGFDPSVGVPGTDYSQQNAAQVTYTDLVIGASNTLTSSANPFTSAHVGNVVNITGGTGFTVGRFVVASVSGSTATMNASPGTNGSTGGTGKLGGGLTLTQGAAWSSNPIFAAVLPGNVVNILGSAGNAASYPTTSLDYNGTGWVAPTAGDGTNGWVKFVADPAGPMPTIGTDGAMFHLTHGWIEGLYLTSASATTIPSWGLIHASDTAVVKGCWLHTQGVATMVGTAFDASGHILGCNISGASGGTGTRAASTGAYGVNTGSNTEIAGCYIHGFGDHGVNDASLTASVIGSIIAANRGDGIHGTNSVATYRSTYAGNTIDGNLANGISITTPHMVTARNNNITNNTTGGLSVASGSAATNSALARFIDYNVLHGNGTNYVNINAGPNDQTVDPSYNSAGTFDWTPTNTATRAAFATSRPGTLS